jgi:hypothetical protein
MRRLRLAPLIAAACLLGAAVAFLVAGSDGDGTGSTAVPSIAATTSSAPSTTVATTAATPATTAPLPSVVPEIEALATRTAMTDEGRRVFYEAEPQLVGKEQLGAACELREEASVLGCFASGRITILAVADPRLDGMMETTAAHEMLHAAWVRLTAAERDQLAAQLQADYERLDDAELDERIDTYRRADPTVIDNELHSILGTEVTGLSSELETYYGRWFADRSQVVALAEASQATFDAIEEEVGILDAELDLRRVEIEQEDTRLEAEATAIEAARVELDRLQAEGRTEEYNAAVPGYNDRVDAYNGAVSALEARIDDYNGLVERRNSLVAEWSELMEPIDTSLVGVPA